MKELDKLDNFCIALFINGIIFIFGALFFVTYFNAYILGWMFIIIAIFHFILSVEFFNKDKLNIHGLKEK